MKYWRWAIVVPFIVATSIALPYSAQASVIYSSQWGTTGGFGLNSTYWAAHKFTAGTNATITSIDMYLGSGSITRLVLRSNNVNFPGTALATMTSSSISSTTQTFTGSFTMTAGTTYWLSAEVVGGSANIGVKSTISDSSAFGWTSGGAILSSQDYGATWGTTYVGGAIVFILRMNGDATDTTAPSFLSSSSFSAPENLATSVNAAVIKVSESATVSISSGADLGSFVIVTSDSTTAYLRFKSPPNFEAPSDSDFNNIYEVTLSATDAAGNIGSQSITITVTDVLDTSTFKSFSLAGAVTNATYRTVIQISATVTVASKITFKAANLRIPGCISILATGSGSTFAATCAWKPSKKGSIKLTASSVPTNQTISGATSNEVNILVLNRSGNR